MQFHAQIWRAGTQGATKLVSAYLEARDIWSLYVGITMSSKDLQVLFWAGARALSCILPRGGGEPLRFRN